MPVQFFAFTICYQFMKKSTFSFLLISTALIGSIFGTSSCNKGQTNTTGVKQELITGDMSFVVPMQLIGENDSMVAFYYKINMDSFVKSFDSKYDTASIRKVQFISCTLTNSDFDVNNNFRNFHTANIGITSATNHRILRIAAAMNIQDTAAYFLNVPNSYNPDLSTYFKADSICYRLYGNMRKGTTIPLNCKATLKYEMTLVK